MSTVRVASAGVKTIQALTLSDAQVEAYASEYIRELDAQNTLLTGGNAYAQRMGRITAPIVQADGYDIRVYQNAEANAFAVADGSIRVYSGLMDIMSDEELLGIIGHEIGHIQHKDTRETFKNALLTSALRDGIASAGGLAATLSDSQLGDLGQALSNSQYSQKQEFEADDYGYAYLKSRGVNPWAMALALEKLQSMQESGRSGGAVSQLFSTHPELEQRIRRMSQRALQDGFNRPQ
ncbi:MAG: M48 family metalloprotease [Rikenellaceae bacterium]|nr:M48 family metalloprotease [Rikenellaceae bacterium]